MNLPVVRSHLPGSWYAGNEIELRKEIKHALDENSSLVDCAVNCVILPHAGYAYSLKAAARTLQKVDGKKFKRAVVVAPAHRVFFRGVSIEPVGGVITPLGQIDTDLELFNQISTLPEVELEPRAHQQEHATQIQLPLLQYFFGSDFKVVSLLCGDITRNGLINFGHKLRDLMTEDTLLVISSDFTHFGTSFRYVPFIDSVRQRLRQLDFMIFDRIKANDFDGLLNSVEKSGATVCGYKAIALMLAMLPENVKVELVDYYTSGDLQNNYKSSVSYLGATVSGDFHAPMKPELREDVAFTEYDGLLSLDIGEKLLQAARATIRYGLDKGRRVSKIEELKLDWLNQIPTEFSAIRGGFVTLHKNGQLRGCIGEIMPRRSIIEVVMEQAINAAFADNRFRPLSKEEFDLIDIEISVLTPPKAINSYSEIELGKHGILLNCQGRSSVFLPQVPPEQGWNLEETLQNLALKAGLSAEAWRRGDAKYQVFEAQIFNEK